LTVAAKKVKEKSIIFIIRLTYFENKMNEIYDYGIKRKNLWTFYSFALSYLAHESKRG